MMTDTMRVKMYANRLVEIMERNVILARGLSMEKFARQIIPCVTDTTTVLMAQMKATNFAIHLNAQIQTCMCTDALTGPLADCACLSMTCAMGEEIALMDQMRSCLFVGNTNVATREVVQNWSAVLKSSSAQSWTSALVQFAFQRTKCVMATETVPTVVTKTKRCADPVVVIHQCLLVQTRLEMLAFLWVLFAMTMMIVTVELMKSWNSVCLWNARTMSFDAPSTREATTCAFLSGR